MKKIALFAAVAVAVAAGFASAEKVRDWKDLHRVHEKIVNAIKDMDRARAANHYDMDGHGEKAVEFLKQAEHELKLAEESARAAK